MTRVELTDRLIHLHHGLKVRPQQQLLLYPALQDHFLIHFLGELNLFSVLTLSLYVPLTLLTLLKRDKDVMRSVLQSSHHDGEPLRLVFLMGVVGASPHAEGLQDD